MQSVGESEMYFRAFVFAEIIFAQSPLYPKRYTNYLEIGRKVHYIRKKTKLRGRQCSASMHLLYHADSDKVSMYKKQFQFIVNENEVDQQKLNLHC